MSYFPALLTRRLPLEERRAPQQYRRPMRSSPGPGGQVLHAGERGSRGWTVVDPIPLLMAQLHNTVAQCDCCSMIRVRATRPTFLSRLLLKVDSISANPESSKTSACAILVKIDVGPRDGPRYSPRRQSKAPPVRIRLDKRLVGVSNSIVVISGINLP
jgi:hypothetical protein